MVSVELLLNELTMLEHCLFKPQATNKTLLYITEYYKVEWRSDRVEWDMCWPLCVSVTVTKEPEHAECQKSEPGKTWQLC